MLGLSVLKYFKNLFAAIAAGRTDYERSASRRVTLSKKELAANIKIKYELCYKNAQRYKVEERNH